MRIGILSDSHGRAARTAQAVATLRDAGADVLVHLGDVETEQVLDELTGHPAHLVFGNCDWNTQTLGRHAEFLGITVHDPLGVLHVGAARIAFTHGHRPEVMQQALADGVDYLLHGHTHQVRDERRGSTRIINPGALFRAGRYTVAVLEPETDRLEIVELGDRGSASGHD